MQVSSSLAKEKMSIHSILKARRPGTGAGARNAAPAPSESIQRSRSAEKARWGWASRFSHTSGLTAPAMRERMKEEACSDPVATALATCPVATFIAAYLRAVMPAMQTPEVLTISHGPLSASSPCTMDACPGMSWSAWVVPQARHWMSRGEKPS